MLEINKIYNCDNIVGMQQLPDECIDLVVTSPPYDNLRTYNNEIKWDSLVFSLVKHDILLDFFII